MARSTRCCTPAIGTDQPHCPGYRMYPPGLQQVHIFPLCAWDVWVCGWVRTCGLVCPRLGRRAYVGGPPASKMARRAAGEPGIKVAQLRPRRSNDVCSQGKKRLCSPGSSWVVVHAQRGRSRSGMGSQHGDHGGMPPDWRPVDEQHEFLGCHDGRDIVMTARIRVGGPPAGQK